MEHDILKSWIQENHLQLNPQVEAKLLIYAQMLHTCSKKFNITGIKNLNDIILHLIIGSIGPVRRLNVPRGTIFADMGSGAGIPGIPVGIIHDHLQGILIEANHKKALFINTVIRELHLDNLSVYHGRIEEYCREEARKFFDIIFSRALGDPYYVIELGAPILKKDGLLYIYSQLQAADLPVYLKEHCRMLGLSIVSNEIRLDHGIDMSGLLLVKTRNTASKYPRSMSVIKREIFRNTNSDIMK